jgi:hypothetical protein
MVNAFSLWSRRVRMKGCHSGRRHSIVMAGLLFILAGLGASAAQDTKQPTLDEILERLEANLDRYDADIPSFFCDEHVISQVVPGERDQNTVTDSVFRLKRTPNPDHTTTLVESREIKSVDGKPATSQKMEGPTLLSGVFEGGLAVVSPNQTSCMNYTLQRINKSRAADPFIVRFATVLTPENTAGCLLQEDSKGRVFIDPASMQIAHLELTTPHHVIFRGDAYTSRVVGERVRLSCWAARPSGCHPRSPRAPQATPEPFTQSSGRTGPPIATTTSWRSRRASCPPTEWPNHDLPAVQHRLTPAVK